MHRRPRRRDREDRVRPEITARGFVEDEEVFQQVIPKVERAIEEAVANGVRDDHQLQQVIRRAVVVGRRQIRRRPMIIPVVLQAWRRCVAPSTSASPRSSSCSWPSGDCAGST